MRLGTVTLKTGFHAVLPLCSKADKLLREALFLLMFMKFLLWDFTGKDVLGSVCSLLCPACDSAFLEDEGNLTAAQCVRLKAHIVTSMHAFLCKYVISLLYIYI